MALALGNRRLGNGYLGSWALGRGNLAKLAHNSGLDESSCSGNLMGTDNAGDIFIGNFQKNFLFLLKETFLLWNEALQLVIWSRSVLNVCSS
jgi:hypothetical protein